MKRITILTLALAAGMSVAMAQQTSSTTSNIIPPAKVAEQMRLQSGPGIVVSTSVTPEHLPEQAYQFLSTDYPKASVTSVNHNIVKQIYDVTLSDGTDITFNEQGSVADITAPKGKTLCLETLADILPQKTSIHLAEAGLIDLVTQVKNITGRGTMVMTLDTGLPTILYDVDGVFVMAYN